MGQVKRQSSKRYPGVRVVVSSTRKLPTGKPDRCFYIRYKLPGGKDKEEKVGWESEGMNAALAAQIRAERIQALRLGEVPETINERLKKQWTFSDFMEEKYLPWAESEKAPKTYQREEQLYRIWLKPLLGSKHLHEISPLDLERVKKKMKEKKRAPRTIELALATVRRAFNKAKDWRLFDGENPVARVKIPREDNRRIRFLTAEEAEALLATVRKRSQQTYEMCVLGLYCGLRFGEIAKLTWADIDLDRGEIYIRDPKNKWNRKVFMPDVVVDMLAQKEKGEPSELVFKDKKHGGMIKRISRSFERAVEELKLNEGIEDRRLKVCFHTLRHTFGSWLVMLGVPIYTVKELMGHKTLAMTERYAHLAAETQKEAVKKLEKVAIRLKKTEPETFKFPGSNLRTKERKRA